MFGDGLDSPINEPFSFDKKWCSHEMTLSLNSHRIVLAHCPYPAGAHPDIKNFKEKLLHHLQPEETVMKDGG